MKKGVKKFTSHDEYFNNVASENRSRLESIQTRVELLIPQALRCISYNIPAYKDEKVFFYFAVFKNHIGIYPPVRNDKNLIKELYPYRNEKGNLSFLLNKPLPLDLIGRVAITLHNEYKK